MTDKRQARLQAAGFRAGDIRDFLGLTQADLEWIERLLDENEELRDDVDMLRDEHRGWTDD